MKVSGYVDSDAGCLDLVKILPLKVPGCLYSLPSSLCLIPWLAGEGSWLVEFTSWLLELGSVVA